jgi:YaiO family outer membrane protein
MWQYKIMLFNPRYGRVGLIAMPFYTFGEMLAPVVELLGYLVTGLGLAFGLVNLSFALLFVLVAWGYGMLLSIWAVVLEEVSFRRYRRFGDLMRLLLFATLENFGYRQCTVWWRLKAFATVWRRVHAWGDMTRKGFGKASVATMLLLVLAAPAAAQTARVAAWGSYEDLSQLDDDWTVAGAQLTLGSSRGHGAWIAGEILGRFDETDITERLGIVYHPGPRVWLSAEAGTSQRPVFSPRNTWQSDATALIGARAAAGITFQRRNYAPGPVDIVIPHLTVEARRMSWDLRVFVSWNQSQRTDAAFTLRATRALTRRTGAWLLGGAGRESYSLGTAVRSLTTVTGVAGLRYNASSGLTVRVDFSVIDAPPLSRRGLSIALERGF